MNLSPKTTEHKKRPQQMSSEIQFLAFGTGNGFIINKEQSIIIFIFQSLGNFSKENCTRIQCYQKLSIPVNLWELLGGDLPLPTLLRGRFCASPLNAQNCTL